MPDSARIPVIVSAARTPIGKFLGGLAPLQAPELGAVAVRAALQRAGVPADEVEEVILGNVIHAGGGRMGGRWVSGARCGGGGAPGGKWRRGPGAGGCGGGGAGRPRVGPL